MVLRDSLCAISLYDHSSPQLLFLTKYLLLYKPSVIMILILPSIWLNLSNSGFLMFLLLSVSLMRVKFPKPYVSQKFQSCLLVNSNLHKHKNLSVTQIQFYSILFLFLQILIFFFIHTFLCILSLFSV